MDFERYRLDINLKSACYYEQLSGKNFFKVGSDVEDILMIIYSSLIVNNSDFKITYQGFLSLIEDPKVMKWIEREYKKMSDIDRQIKIELSDTEKEKEKGRNEDVDSITMTELVSSLIVQHKIDPHYVMYEMSMWEIMPFFKCADSVKKDEMVEKRLWTYIQVSPQIDTKKCKTPDALLPFPWEAEDRKKKAEKELKNNMYAATNMIGRSLFGDKGEKKKENG